jgi:hypothetical protein
VAVIVFAHVFIDLVVHLALIFALIGVACIVVVIDAGIVVVIEAVIVDFAAVVLVIADIKSVAIL